jgi:hypothetical protein
MLTQKTKMSFLLTQALSLISRGPYGSDISESHGRQLQSVDVSQQFDGSGQVSVGNSEYLFNGRGRTFPHFLAGAVENVLASKWRHDEALYKPVQYLWKYVGCRLQGYLPQAA